MLSRHLQPMIVWLQRRRFAFLFVFVLGILSCHTLWSYSWCDGERTAEASFFEHNKENAPAKKSGAFFVQGRSSQRSSVARARETDGLQSLASPNHLAPVFDTLLKRWDAIANKAGIAYSLTFGTYLGWLRNRTYIPYDQDMDVHIGKESLGKILRLAAYPWCSFNSDLKAQPLQDEEIRLVLYAEHKAPMLNSKRPRFDCQGRKVSMQVDSCSFNGPLARLVYLTRDRGWWTRTGVKTRHLDVFLYHDKIDSKFSIVQKNSVCVLYASYIPSMFSTTLPPVQRCSLNAVNTSCFYKDYGHNFMRCKYGPDYMTQNKRWNALLQRWIDTHNSIVFEVVLFLFIDAITFLQTTAAVMTACA